MLSIFLPVILFFFFLFFYFFLSAESVKPELLQSVHMGEISQRDANELQERMESKRLRSLFWLGFCVIVFASTLAFVFWEKYLHFDDDIVMILIIGGLCVPILTAVFQISKFVIAQTYLSALKRGRPGSVTNAHPLYNLNKINNRLLEKISARKFTDAEARGLLNIANAARSVNKRFLIPSVAFIVLAILGLADPLGFGVYVDDYYYMSVLSLAIFAAASFTRFANLRKNARYISAIRAAYPFLNEARW